MTMTKTILIALSIAALAHTASAQSFSFATPAPAPAPPAPVAPPAPPAVPAPVVAPLPPEPPDVPFLYDGDFDFNFDFDFDFDFQGLADIDVQVDKALKASEKALEKLPKLMAMQVPVPAPPAPPARALGPYKFGSDENAYDQARNMIERDQYDRALEALDRVIEGKGSRVEAAMYWKAYSLSKLARRPEGLTVLDSLQKQFPNGQWVKDAKSLEVELRQASGQSVSADSVDDDIKLLALRSMMQGNAEQALPQVERLLQGNSSVRVKQRALILLGQSNAPRARTVLANVARNGSNPDLRLSAISYLGRRNDPESAQFLEETYRSTSDRDVKQAILRSFMQSPNAIDKLAQVARTEKDEELQKTAIRSLGSSGRSEAAEALRQIYVSDASTETRKAVIDALSMQRTPTVLIALAKAEKNLELKKQMISRLGNSRSPEVLQYMTEILEDKK
jgi:HEAT repeat protein